MSSMRDRLAIAVWRKVKLKNRRVKVGISRDGLWKLSYRKLSDDGKRYECDGINLSDEAMMATIQCVMSIREELAAWKRKNEVKK